MIQSSNMHWVARLGCLVGAMYCLYWCSVVHADEEVPHRTSNDIYMNPCKARGFMGDIALSDEEVDMFDRSRRYRRPNITHSLQKDIQSISRQKQFFEELLKDRKSTHEELCQQKSTLSPETCHKTRNQITNIRRRWRTLNQKLGDLRSQIQSMADLPLGPDKETRHSRRRRAATAKKERLWDYGVVPYVIGENFTANHRALFQLAMRHWENHTCITFRDREPSDTNYITFAVEPCGCCSYVGKKGTGPQSISIGKNCEKFGIVVHELGHVIGYWHEHTRPDRDQYVQIFRENIIPSQQYNFDKMTYTDINSLGEPYDFDSIMHYSRNTFAKQNFMDTILARRMPGMAVRPAIGQRFRLSESDIRQANKLYKCPKCGSTLQESSAEFKHTPTRGKPELCQWRISATHGEKIVLNVTRLSIPKSKNCETDYLEIRDGYYVKSPLIGRYCGDDLPDTLESTGSRMWIEFRSRRGQGHGFTANYEAMCGGEISNEEGFLTSPNYPNDYRPNKNCAWKISVPEGYTVALKFQSFGIEKHDNCVYDYLEIRDGPNEESLLITNLCGYTMPKNIQTTSRHMYIRFVSDDNVQKSGFYAVFTKEHDECATEHGCDHICENTLGSYKCSCNAGYQLHTDGRTCQDACGGFLDQENGTFTSPSYPDLYPSNRNCVWQIVAPGNHKIHINFTHFDVEGTNNECEFDSVRVSSGSGNNIKPHGVFCGNSLPAEVTSTGNTMQIEFNSDSTVQKTGFTAYYQIDKDECSLNNGGCQHVCKNTVGSYYCACLNGYILHDDGHGCKEGGCRYDITSNLGIVESPNFPEDYPSRKDCIWHFSTVKGHRVRLSFKTFELEPNQECIYDHIDVHDGPDREARSLGKFCGANLPKPVISTDNEMCMYFFSDVSVQRKGFQIEHDTVCGAALFTNTTPQTFVSHARYGDYNYNNMADCEWKLLGASGQVITLDFQEFNVEDERSCGYDAVRVYDGLMDSDPLIGVYCGSRIPERITSSSDALLVRFQSDDTIVMKGFSASFYMAPPTVEPEDILGVFEEASSITIDDN